MQTRLVITFSGPDRPGLVDQLSRVIAAVSGSWQKSRLARLSGQFAGIVEVTVGAGQAAALTASLKELVGLEVSVHPAEATAFDNGDVVRTRVARLAFVGQDRPGLVQAISRVLARACVNVDALETRTVMAPMSGVPLFEAEAEVHLPPHLNLDELRAELELESRDLLVDLDLVEDDVSKA